MNILNSMNILNTRLLSEQLAVGGRNLVECQGIKVACGQEGTNFCFRCRGKKGVRERSRSWPLVLNLKRDLANDCKFSLPT